MSSPKGGRNQRENEDMKKFILFDPKTRSTVSVHAELQGREWMAICPKHPDAHPSLSINEEKGVFFCHGCEWKGKLSGRVLATYKYEDESGNFLFGVDRLHPKQFRQWRREPHGNRIYNLEGVKTVPYRLPEVIEAEDIAIVEGEKDVDRLRESGVTATCNPMGAGKWREHFNRYFKDKRVAIIPDNDLPGVKHAETVARSLKGIAASVKVIELPGLPEKGDVSDWLEKGNTKDDLFRIIEKTPEWTEKLSKLPKLLKLPLNNKPISDEIIFPMSPFPLKIFPNKLRGLIRKASKALHVEPEIVASAMLAIASAAIGNTIRISPKEGYNVPPFIWLIVIASSGYGKTPAFQVLLKPVGQRQAKAYQDYKEALRGYETEMARIRRGESSDGIPDKPKAEHFLIEDFTIEALGNVFEDCGRGVICYISEIAAIISGLNQYKARGNDRQHYLKLFDCDSWKIDRKAHGVKFVPNTGASIIGGIQPKMMPRIFRDEAFDEGLIPRFLLIVAESKPLKFSRVAITEDDMSYWAELLDWCYRMPAKLDENGFIKPKIFNLTKKALRYWERFYNDCMERMTLLSENAQVFIPKLTGYYSLKIAGVLYCMKKFDWGEKTNGKIDFHTVKESISIIRYFAGQTMRALRLYDREGEFTEAQKKLIRILYDLKNEIKRGKLQLLLITDAFNDDLPKNVKLIPKQIRNMLTGLGLTVKKSTRNLAFLMWETDKVESLFSKVTTVTTVTSVTDEEN